MNLLTSKFDATPIENDIMTVVMLKIYRYMLLNSLIKRYILADISMAFLQSYLSSSPKKEIRLAYLIFFKFVFK